METKKNIVFVVNPFAGHNSKSKIPGLIHTLLDKEKFNYKLIETEYAGHGIELTKQAVAEKADAVIAVGGDGTVNEVASQLVHVDTALGIIPGGSGNGLSMHLGIGRSAKKAIQIINAFNIDKMDSARVNDQFYLNMAGVGLDGLVAYKTKLSSKRGFKTYLKGALSEAIKYKNLPYKVEIDGKEYDGKFLSINVANGSMFGYNFKIAADANTSDGLMDTLMIHDAHKMNYFGNAWRFWAGRIHKSKFASINKSSTIKVTAYEDCYMHIDGEGFPCKAGELEFKVLESSLKVIS